MFHHVFLPVFSARRHPRIRVLKVRKSWSSACACCPPRVCACNLFVCAATDTAPSASGRAPDQPLGRCADMILTHSMCRAADQRAIWVWLKMRELGVTQGKSLCVQRGHFGYIFLGHEAIGRSLHVRQSCRPGHRSQGSHDSRSEGSWAESRGPRGPSRTAQSAGRSESLADAEGILADAESCFFLFLKKKKKKWKESFSSTSYSAGYNFS